MGNTEPAKVNTFSLAVSIILAVVWIVLAVSSWLTDKSAVLVWIFSWGAVISLFFVLVDLPKTRLSQKSIKIAKIVLLAVYIIVTAIFIFT